MRTRPRFLATLAAVGLALMAAAPASGATGGDWISVDRALVNKLGGVSVSGEVSCAGTYAQLLDGSLEYVDENEQWLPIPAPTDTQLVNIFVNADTYTVSQPAGRRLMIQVEHGSSRMHPCFAQHPYDEDGRSWQEIGQIECRDETTCRWETDRYAYDRVTLGPLFDYSPDGKFKTGNLNVDVSTYGSMVAVYDTATQTWDYYGVPQTPDIYTQQIVRATMYR
ncbi:hypothetical protein [Humibacillus xanthopallidus]|uniref:hypothetical protein n=1 Tax=Humibacillus xanthopallidus TaxID=412689 RepID=UPI00384F042B